MCHRKVMKNFILSKKGFFVKRSLFHMKIQLITEVTEELPVVPDSPEQA